MRHATLSRRLLAASAGVTLVASLAACGGDSGGGSDSGDGGGGTLVFGASQDPVILDGAFVSDGESIRPIRQVFEGLVTTAPGSTDIVPALATEWEPSADGLEWTFTLREDVTFHDDEPLDAEAVCFNFDRWYNFTGVLQSSAVSYYWSTVMGGFAANEDPTQSESLYAGCEAVDETTATIRLARPSSTFLTALSLPAFSIGSPKALEEYGADEVSGTGESPSFDGTYGYEHPTGTGPYVFDSWERGSTLTLKANPDYWGEPASVETLTFSVIPDGPARRQALEAGDIDGYDLVDPADVDSLEQAGFQILRRPAFNVGYLGFNQKFPPLDNPKIRQAIAHAINKENLVRTNYPEGAEVATQFQPPELFGWSDAVPTYDYDVERAKALVAESGVANPTLEFWYPTDVSRPYMPNAQANWELIKTDLEAAGFTIVPKSAPWNPQYLDANQSGQQQMFLIGWTGDFGDPDNFIGTFFQSFNPQFGFENQEIFDALDAAEAEPDEATRATMYEGANELIMDFLPGVPYVHTEPAIAFREGISGYEPSPVNNEDFNTVTID